MLPSLSCLGVSKYPMKTTDAVPKTAVFGTLRQTPQIPGVYAWDGVPKAVPKSKAQKLNPVDELWDSCAPARSVPRCTSHKRHSEKFAKKNITHLGDTPGSDAR
jgi:hypothetical protein